jgi:DNA-binding XRE family transcriptional regulator
MTHPLAEARKRANLSQQALANLIERDRVSVARIESGRQRASIKTVSRIIVALRKFDVELSADAFLDRKAS